MLEFIKSYYEYILVGAVVLVLLILVLINIFKKPREQKIDIINSILAPTKERGLKKSYKSEFVIFKRGIQDYYLFLFNSNGDLIFKSEVFSSLITLKSDFESIKNSIINNNWHLNVLLNGRVYLKFSDDENKKSMGYSMPFKENELDLVYNEIEELFKVTPLPEEATKDLTLIQYKIVASDLPIKRSKNSWVYKQIEDEYYYSLLNENKEAILNTECFWNKRELKRSLTLYKDSIRSGNFIIDKDRDDMFYFILLDFNRNTLFISSKYDTVDECNLKIKEIIKNA